MTQRIETLTQDRAGREAPILRLVPDTWSDQALLEGLRARDPAAARAFFDAHIGRVEALVWRLLGADPGHDDVVQQALANIVASLHTVKEPAALAGWVVGVTVNTVRRELRSRGRRREAPASDDLPELGMASGAEARSLVKRCFRVLDQLPADERIAFVLRFVEGYSLPEVAATCACSLATAKRRLRRARQRFDTLARADFHLAALVVEEAGP